MRRGKMPTGYVLCCKTPTGSSGFSVLLVMFALLLLPCWLHFFWNRRDRAYLGNKTVGQLPCISIFLPEIDYKKIAIVRLGFGRRFLDTFKFHHGGIAQIDCGHLL